MKKKVAYILYNERLNNPIIKKQVIDLIIELSASKKVKITLIAIWHPLNFLLNKNKLKKLKIYLLKNNVIIENYIFALPNRFFFYKKLPLSILIFYLEFFFSSIKLNRFDVLHCRSYLPTYISLKKRTYDQKVIFDMRSLLPEENITLNKWSLGSPIYKKWKNIEYFNLKNSNHIITVSEPMKVQISNTYNYKKISNIHLIGTKKNVKIDKNLREKVRNNYKISNKFVILYVGTLDKKILNNVNNYAKFANKLINQFRDLYFIFSVPKIKKYFYDVFKTNNVPQDNFMFIEGITDELYYAADAGINVMSKSLDSHTRFGIKISEYLSYGLPIIIKNVGGAEEFVKKYNLGIICNKDDYFEKFKKLIEQPIDREKIIHTSKNYFSLSLVSKKYLNIYIS